MLDAMASSSEKPPLQMRSIKWWEYVTWGQWLKERYEDARLVPIEGDDHCYNYHLEEVLKAVKEFLTEEANLDSEIFWCEKV